MIIKVKETSDNNENRGARNYWSNAMTTSMEE